MGRRALKKIDPAFDLHGWLIDESDFVEHEPVVPAVLFGREAPLEIEVGTGKGLFLAQATGAVPGHDFLGIEISVKYARYAAAQLAKLQRTNGKVIHGDAVRMFRQHLPAGSAVAVHVYFPDPWWKHRHRKRRVLNASFVADVDRVLVPGGVLHFWTDVLEYFETTLELIGRTSRFERLPVGELVAGESEFDYRTHFERRMRLHDQPVYRAEFRVPTP